MKKLFLIALLLAVVAAGYAQTNAGPNAALKNPGALKERAPNKYTARFDTTAGVFVVEVTSDWSPHGADRFYNLVKNGFFDG